MPHWNLRTKSSLPSVVPPRLGRRPFFRRKKRGNGRRVVDWVDRLPCWTTVRKRGSVRPIPSLSYLRGILIDHSDVFSERPRYDFIPLCSRFCFPGFLSCFYGIFLRSATLPRKPFYSICLVCKKSCLSESCSVLALGCFEHTHTYMRASLVAMVMGCLVSRGCVVILSHRPGTLNYKRHPDMYDETTTLGRILVMSNACRCSLHLAGRLFPLMLSAPWSMHCISA